MDIVISKYSNFQMEQVRLSNNCTKIQAQQPLLLLETTMAATFGLSGTQLLPHSLLFIFLQPQQLQISWI